MVIVISCKCQVSARGIWRAKLAQIISGWYTDMARGAANELLAERPWDNLL